MFVKASHDFSGFAGMAAPPGPYYRNKSNADTGSFCPNGVPDLLEPTTICI
jgi:hypothetical protein